ncbi:MAG: GntR family transcriptional regulator [Desulfobacterales bacterium]|nr:GntR family transcriptional regulator [Desulfobacterales bacterium]
MKKEAELINNKTLGHQVLDRLRAKIMDLDFLPGESVSLKGLAELFGVSIQPVREAVWQLEAEGILHVKPNKGIQISQLSAKEFKEISMMRLNLESLALTEACSRRTDKHIAAARKVLKIMKRKIKENDPKEYMRQNVFFHYELYRAADMPFLLRTIDTLRLRVHPYIYQSVTTSRAIADTFQVHADILEGVKNRDAPAAVKSLREDLQEVTDYLLGVWEKQNLV